MAQSTFAANGAVDIGQDIDRYDVPTVLSGVLALPASAGATSARTDASPIDANPEMRLTGGFLQAASSGNGQFSGSIGTFQSYTADAPMSSHLALVYRDALSNASGTAQQASFALNIASLLFVYQYPWSYGTDNISFTASLYVDGIDAPLWTSGFNYNRAVDAVSGPVTTGVDLGLAAASQSEAECQYGPGPSPNCEYQDGAGFSITGYHADVPLGSVAAGSSIGIRYEIDLSTETQMYGGNAAVFFNDPALLSSSGPAAAALSFDAPGVAAVPEPQTYALMAAGIGLMAAARRRRNR